MSTDSSSSSSSDEDIIHHSILYILNGMYRKLSDGPLITKKGGSYAGRQKNRKIGRKQGAHQIDLDYFCRIHIHRSPMFSVAEFERRFAITRPIYEKLRSALCQANSFFIQRKDASWTFGATTDQKMTGALLQLSSGVSADHLVSYIRLHESTLLSTLKEFCRTVVECFRDEHLRRPSESDIKKIESDYSRLGFPGCLGAVDCSGWEWRNCPVAWHGQYKGKENKPMLRMEVLCDDKLHIWHMMFGSPGAKNDISIMSQSSLFNDIRNGKWPLIKPSTNISGIPIEWFFFLSDGIYPRLRFFAKPHPDAKSKKQRLYTAVHSSARKSVERVFAALFGQFEILDRPARLGNREDLNNIVLCCSILHNMVAEERGYNGTAKFRVGEHEVQTSGTLYDTVSHPNCSYEQANIWRELLDPVDDLQNHLRLQDALISNIWNTHGDNEGDV